ncbi:hypothetical protein [Acidiphilium sp.]|uniref:hypothetical protein n=1 Tax=Acidiphilium sp. TaxID=527 RepID=UPI003CFCCC1B
MATTVMQPFQRHNGPSEGRRWLPVGTVFVGLAAASTIAPMPTASANMLYDPHVVMYTFMSSGVDDFDLEYPSGMPAVARMIQSCYAVNDHPGWYGRFITCNAEDVAAYLYSQYLLKTRGITPVPYFDETAFERRQNLMLERYRMPPAQWPAWIVGMRRRVWRLLVVKINGGVLVPPS